MSLRLLIHNAHTRTVKYGNEPFLEFAGYGTPLLAAQLAQFPLSSLVVPLDSSPLALSVTPSPDSTAFPPAHVWILVGFSKWVACETSSGWLNETNVLVATAVLRLLTSEEVGGAEPPPLPPITSLNSTASKLHNLRSATRLPRPRSSSLPSADSLFEASIIRASMTDFAMRSPVKHSIKSHLMRRQHTSVLSARKLAPSPSLLTDESASSLGGESADLLDYQSAYREPPNPASPLGVSISLKRRGFNSRFSSPKRSMSEAVMAGCISPKQQRSRTSSLRESSLLPHSRSFMTSPSSSKHDLSFKRFRLSSLPDTSEEASLDGGRPSQPLSTSRSTSSSMGSLDSGVSTTKGKSSAGSGTSSKCGSASDVDAAGTADSASQLAIDVMAMPGESSGHSPNSVTSSDSPRNTEFVALGIDKWVPPEPDSRSSQAILPPLAATFARGQPPEIPPEDVLPTFFAMLFESLPPNSYLLVIQQTPDGELISQASPEAALVLESDSLVGTDVWKSVHPDDLEFKDTMYAAAAAEGARPGSRFTCHARYRRFTNSGALVMIDATIFLVKTATSAAVMGVLEVDNTSALVSLANARRLTSLVGSLDLGVLLVSRPPPHELDPASILEVAILDATVCLTINSRMAEFLDLPLNIDLAPLAGTALSELGASLDFLSTLAPLLLAGESVHGREVAVRTSAENGGIVDDDSMDCGESRPVRYFRMDVVAIIDDEYLITYQDVTPEKQLLVETVRNFKLASERESDQIERQALQEFLRCTSHDIRTPLQGVTSAALLLHSNLLEYAPATDAWDGATSFRDSSPSDSSPTADSAPITMTSSDVRPNSTSPTSPEPRRRPSSVAGTLVPPDSVSPPTSPSKGRPTTSHSLNSHSSDGELRRNHSISSARSFGSKGPAGGDSNDSFRLDIADSLELVDIISASAQMVEMIISNVLDVEAIKHGGIDLELAPCALLSRLEALISVLRYSTSHKANVVLNVTLPEFIPPVVCDAPRLLRAVMNLLTNAIKFTEEGTVELEVRFMTASPADQGEISGTLSATIHFVVRDTGCGMSPAELARIGTLYAHKPIEEGGGSGIGLYNVVHSLAGMGSQLHITSEPDVGTTASFSIVCPLQLSAHTEGVEHLSPRSKSPGRNFPPIAILSQPSSHDHVANLAIPAPVASIISSPTKPAKLRVRTTNNPRARRKSISQLLSGESEPSRPLATSTPLQTVPEAVSPKKTSRTSSELAGSAPASSSADAAAASRPSTRSARPRNRDGPMHVLFVEDNVINRKVGKRLLEKMGHTVTVACDGGEAHDMLLTTETPTYDLVFMDISMPVMRGTEVTAKFRAWEKEALAADPSRPYTPIYALTGNVTEEDRAACYEAGCDGFLTKPCTPATLQRAFDEVRSALPIELLRRPGVPSTPTTPTSPISVSITPRHDVSGVPDLRIGGGSQSSVSVCISVEPGGTISASPSPRTLSVVSSDADSDESDFQSSSTDGSYSEECH
ncbi:sensor protein [Thecamonas trahens ATCC 50062]|uniref:histidine kinase n=1 Tax=Thecamonas trahens ATCC 50062 TaxID=461836 RepID=A0A0L0D106_THETB|nr:sensor protein [Thecamonas trahens ATCC 50062]KNC45912.1 sensor protein [Thecamonas trahens ATCC 50062]|eukprot:XP_013762900.1 sensor protein [Thecamonas trahens ATCC 50062]